MSTPPLILKMELKVLISIYLGIEPEFDFKINYRLEVRKQHLLS